MFEMTAGDIIGWVLFGGIGIVACAWGKMKEYWQPWVLGVGLMVFPYFIPRGVWMWVVGLTLSGLLFFARE
jgi:hypothetical protein